MSKKVETDTERFHSVLYKEDLDFLRQNYGPGSANAALGVSGAIRFIVHLKVQGLKAKTNKLIDDKNDSRAVGPAGEKL